MDCVETRNVQPEPPTVTAGDKVAWTRTFDEFPASDFTLKYVLVNTTRQIIIDAETSDDGTSFSVSVLGATTAAWVPGVYKWTAFVRDGDDNRTTVAQGDIRVLPNPETATNGIDEREADEKILDAIKDLLQGKVLNGDAQMYEIHGRRLQRYTFAELETLRNVYALRVRNIRRKRGEKMPSRTIRTSFCG